MVTIVDISAHQDPRLFDYDLFCKQVDGVIIRNTYGAYGDKHFETHYQEITGRGKPVGTYSFLTEYNSVDSQIEKMHRATENKKFKLGRWCDAEYEDGATPLTANTVIHWMTDAESLFGEHGVYTGNWCWRSIMGLKYAMYKTRKCWLSAYTTYPIIPTGWDNWWLWQYSASGRLTSYANGNLNIDMNRFRGTDAEYFAWIGEDMPITLPETNTKTVEIKAVNVPTLLVRSGAGTTYSIKERLTFGQRVEILDRIVVGNDVWARIGYKQYSAIMYNGVEMLR